MKGAVCASWEGFDPLLVQMAARSSLSTATIQTWNMAVMIMTMVIMEVLVVVVVLVILVVVV